MGSEYQNEVEQWVFIGSLKQNACWSFSWGKGESGSLFNCTGFWWRTIGGGAWMSLGSSTSANSSSASFLPEDVWTFYTQSFDPEHHLPETSVSRHAKLFANLTKGQFVFSSRWAVTGKVTAPGRVRALSQKCALPGQLSCACVPSWDTHTGAPYGLPHRFPTASVSAGTGQHWSFNGPRRNQGGNEKTDYICMCRCMTSIWGL